MVDSLIDQSLDNWCACFALLSPPCCYAFVVGDAPARLRTLTTLFAFRVRMHRYTRQYDNYQSLQNAVKNIFFW